MPHRRQPPRHAGRFEPARIEIGKIVAQRLGFGLGEGLAAAGEKFGEIGEVAPVGVKSMNRPISLVSEFLELIGCRYPPQEDAPALLTRRAAPRHPHHTPSFYFLRNLSGGIVTIISRGFGLTKFARA
jgi:hypothetical protein